MTIRMTPADSARRASTSIGRATLRSVDDNHLMQQVNQADVMHSESPTEFERFQMLGMTSVPMKQQEQQGQQGQQGQGQGGGGGGNDSPTGSWNNSQPKGEAAEAMMFYPGGDRSHPVAMVDDRRVRPYDMKEGESAFYSADGSGQMVHHNADGVMMMTVDESGGDGSLSAAAAGGAKERFSSIAHVTKEKQSRKPQQSAGGTSGGAAATRTQQDHRGTSNTEVRSSKAYIDFILDGQVFAFIDREEKKMYVGVKHEEKDQAKKVITEGGPSDKLYAKPGA